MKKSQQGTAEVMNTMKEILEMMCKGKAMIIFLDEDQGNELIVHNYMTPSNPQFDKLDSVFKVARGLVLNATYTTVCGDSDEDNFDADGKRLLKASQKIGDALSTLAQECFTYKLARKDNKSSDSTSGSKA
jgi:hypothetical protein